MTSYIHVHVCRWSETLNGLKSFCWKWHNVIQKYLFEQSTQAQSNCSRKSCIFFWWRNHNSNMAVHQLTCMLKLCASLAKPEIILKYVKNLWLPKLWVIMWYTMYWVQYQFFFHFSWFSFYRYLSPMIPILAVNSGCYTSIQKPRSPDSFRPYLIHGKLILR